MQVLTSMLTSASKQLFSLVGANLNERDQDGFTALHHAARNGHLYAVQLLLDLGANPKVQARYVGGCN